MHGKPKAKFTILRARLKSSERHIRSVEKTLNERYDRNITKD
jgi:hypothetical protein